MGSVGGVCGCRWVGLVSEVGGACWAQCAGLVGAGG